MPFQLLVTITVVLVTFSSVYLGRTWNMYVLILCGMLFLTHVYLEKRYPRLLPLLIITLALYHWVSQLNWCNTISLIVIAKYASTRQELGKSIMAALLFTTVYSIVRLSYEPWNMYTLMVTLFDLFVSVVVALTVRCLTHTEYERKDLSKRFDFLIKYDALTGLVNYQECHLRLQELVEQKTRLLFILFDCNDLKALNSEYGHEGGNRILLNASWQLQEIYPDAFFIARYGGDEFAVVARVPEQEDDGTQAAERFVQEAQLNMGIEVTYGSVLCPDEACSKEEILSLAEKRVAVMKRELWLKREEDLLRSEKLRAVGELAAGMAHEIRNPITSVKGFMQLAKEDNYNIERWYDIIMQEISRVNELTSELLQFSKPHMTQYRTESLTECIRRIVQLTESEAILRGHQLRVELDGEEMFVLMNKDKMIQVLINLVKNAFEAMLVSGTVTIRLYRKLDRAVIEVADTGRGIPESELSQIFLPFYTTKEHGTGLGLSVCHKIVEDQGGILSVTSEENVGTTFHITLPIEQ